MAMIVSPGLTPACRAGATPRLPWHESEAAAAALAGMQLPTMPILLELSFSSPTPIAYLAQYWYGSAFSRIFLVTVVYSVFSLMVVQIAAIGRLIYSLSRDNMFPGSKLFARVDAKTRTPIAAIILTTVIYIAVMMVCFAHVLASLPPPTQV